MRGIIIMQWCEIIRRLKKMELRKDQKKQTGDADGFFTALGVDGHLFNYDAIDALKESSNEDWKEDE
jgi:hypothetical protein